MPEPRVVPRGRSISPVPLPDGALDTIRARAHRRKAARAAVAGSAGTAALVVLASLVAVSGMTESREDSLQIVPAVPSLEPAPVPAEEVPASAPEQLETGVASGTAPRQAAAARPRSGATPGQPSAVAPAEVAQAPAPRTQRRFDPDPVQDNSPPIILPPDCEQLGTGAVDGWCLQAFINPDDVWLSMCRARGYGAARLEWATSQRVRFQVNDPEGRPVWTYDPRVRPEAAELEVPAESCVGWRVPYLWQDEQGAKLPPGNYTLRGASAARGLTSSWTEARFSVQDGSSDPVEPAAPTLRDAPKVPSVT